MPTCKVCGMTDAEVEFYASINTHCKEHWKEKVRANRIAKSDYYRSFDKMRASMPHRVLERKAYAKTDAGKERHKAANSKWIAKYPARRKASHIVNNALRDGKLQKLPCFICGNSEVEAHHASYDLPLVVTWLCVEHHKEIHWQKMKEAA